MKKVLLIALVLLTVFSCNQKKKSSYISVEKKIEDVVAKEEAPDPATADTTSYAYRGLTYALKTQAVLSKSLTTAIEKTGTEGALSFCNEKAYTLTDSMAIAQKTNLKRVTDKPRNPSNLASTTELEYIETFKQIIANNEEPTAMVTDVDGLVKVYYPIITKAMCLQCHGKPNSDITPPTLKKLSALYANDNAVGYSINEVRGMWSVLFKK